MKCFGIKEAWVHKVLASFCDQMTCEELQQEKTKQLFFPQFFPEPNFVFFLHKPLQCPNTTKICTQLVDHSLFDAKKIIFFLNFLAILFQIYYSQVYILSVFPRHELLECPNSMKICTHLAHMSIFDLTKFQIFFLKLPFFQDGQSCFTRW